MGNVLDQQITDRWAVYNGDCMEVMGSIPDGSAHLSIYSPPFAGLYQYSSSERDLSNNLDYDSFFTHYEHVVRELYRITMPGRRSLVHCMDVPRSNSGRNDSLMDFPGDIIRMHEEIGFAYVGRYHIWNEPLAVRNRTMTKGLTHKTIVDDAAQCTIASADYLLAFRKKGDNPVPIVHEHGLMEYAGASPVPPELMPYRGWTGKQTENRYSHWIWRQYASAIWDDIRGKMGDRALDAGAVLPFRESRDPDDEKHVHPLQLDIIHRGVQLWSNPGETVFTPFMGVGSEVYEAVRCGRRGVGAELKPSYYKQALRNLAAVDKTNTEEASLFDSVEA